MAKRRPRRGRAKHPAAVAAPAVPSRWASVAWDAPALHGLLLGLVGAAVYAPSLGVPFYLDDFSSIQENPALVHGGPGELWAYAPLRIVGYLSLWLNYQLHQFNPAGYHAVNLAAHLLTAWVVYALSAALLRAPRLQTQAGPTLHAWLPLLTAALFLSHPLQTQAVTYIVQRLAVFAALFYLLSLYCFVHARLATLPARRWQWAGLCVLTALLALFTKQNTATLPLALLLTEVLLFSSSAAALRRALAAGLVGVASVWLLLALALDYNPVSLAAMQALSQETSAISRSDYLATQSLVLWHYLRLFVWPLGLHLDYDFPLAAGFAAPGVLLALVGHLALLGLALYLARRRPLLALGLGFYYLAHAVESSLIPIRDVAFEHRTYLPNLGLCWIAAYGLLHRPAPLKRPWPWVLPALLVLGLSLATWQRNQVWRDPLRLWQANAELTPAKARVWAILGKHRLQAGQAQAGVDALNHAIALQQAQNHGVIDPADVVNLVVGLKMLQRHEDALALVRQTLRQDLPAPILAKLLVNQGNIYFAQNRFDLAEQSYFAALAADPHNLPVEANLASLLGRQGRLREAEALYLRVLQIDPDNSEVQRNLRIIRQRMGIAP